MAPRVTLKRVNQALKEKFSDGLELRKWTGRGGPYHHFAGPIAATMFQTALYGSPNLSSFTVEEIVKIATERLARLK